MPGMTHVGTLKVVSLNANGLRAAVRRGLFEWLIEQQFDIICLQETKMNEAHPTLLEGYYGEYSHAEKKGYSGVAIYSKVPPQHVSSGLGFQSCDTEGRFLQFDFKHFSVASIYFPSGSSGEHRQVVKMDFLEKIEATLKAIQTAKRPTILCGDYNIAHREIDLKNWKANQKNSGFLPEERAWMDHLLNDFNYQDAFRSLHPTDPGYTWWSFRGRAWEKNVGWRIDYQIVTQEWVPLIQAAYVVREPRFSDHAALVVEYRSFA